MSKVKIYLFLISILLVFQNSNAQKLLNGFKQLSVDSGLSHSDAIDIVQDNYAYLWISTNSGLNKFDGYNFETFKWEPNNGLSIPGNRILKLLKTKNKIWLLIENKGLYYYDLLTLSFHLVKKIPNATPINSLLEKDKDQNIFLFQELEGLTRISTSGKIIQSKISFLTGKATYPQLKKLVEIHNEKYFVSIDGEVYKYSKEKNNLILYDKFNYGDFETASTLSNNNLLIRFEKGFYLWNNVSKTKKKVNYNTDFLKNSRVNCIYKIGKLLYIGTDNGLFLAKLNFNKSEQLYIDKELIANIKVNAVFKDKYNMLWVASSGYGIFYKNLDQLPFHHIYNSNLEDSKKYNFTKNFSSSILKDRNSNEIWFGTKRGVELYDTSLKKYVGTIKELSNKHIRCLFQDSNGEIWAGTKENGLYRFLNKKLIQNYQLTTNSNNSISDNHIISITEDGLNRIWIAGFNNGANIYNKTKNSFQSLFNEPFNKQSLGSNNTSYLFYNKKQNNMYVSSRDAGITIINLKDVTKFTYKHINIESAKPLSSNYTWSINAKNSDTVYVGTIGGGLNILTYKNENYNVDYLTIADGLPDNDIESVQIDASGKVWMGGRGISSFNPITKEIKNFDVNDGLQSNSFKIGASFYDAKNETMYFGGVNGVNYFNTKEIKESVIPPDISIKGIEVFNSPIKIGKELNDRVLLKSRVSDSTQIILNAKENEFSITYTPLKFNNPYRNKIRYKLEPYQKQWIERDFPNFKTTYSNLPSGKYTFKVQAINSNNTNIASKIAVLKINVKPYWYLTNVAIFLYLLIAVALLLGYNDFISNKRKIKQKLLLAEKEQLLNQGKLDFFAKISHEFRTPLTLISGPLDDLIHKRETNLDKEDVLKSMSRHVNRLLNMVNKLLDFRKMDLGHDVIKASPTNINEFVDEVFNFFKGKAFSKIIDYEFVKLPNETNIYIDKEKIETILINLLSNAFKFTPNGGRINIKMTIIGDEKEEAIFNDLDEPIENYLKISISDTGNGIPITKKDKIFNQYYQIEKNSSFEAIGNGIGLALVKSICNLHHLKIDLKSILGKGSTFSLRLPFGKKYLGTDELEETNIYKSTKPTIVLHQTPSENNAKNNFDANLTIGKKILIVEDNIEIRNYLNHHLKEHFKILNAENGKLGLEITKTKKPDLILSDVMMPEMDGMEFAKLIKTDEELHHIPIILLTALTSTSHEMEGLQLGIEDYIRKPFKIDILLAKINTILKNRKNISDYYSKQLHFTPKSVESLTEDEVFLQKMIQLIENNLDNEKLNVAFICSNMAMGRTKLYGKIKEITGHSIVEFIRDIRLKKAGNLLLETSKTIEQISYQVGINNIKYFRKHFKEMYHLTPSQYKKNKSKNSI